MPIKCFEGTTKPHEPFWRVINADQSESGEGEIEFYGYISEYSWFGDDITPAKFKDDLNNIGKGGPVTVRINSGGGEMFAASVIRSIIMDYQGKVTTRIDGLCASAATYVAMAGDVVKIQDTAMFMIHDPRVMAFGTAEDLKEMIEFLKTAKNSIIAAYQAKTKLESDQLSKLMSKETWMTAKEAKEMGFVDEVISTSAKGNPVLERAAIVNAVRIAGDLSNYVNVPAVLLATQEANMPDEKNQQAAERLRAEIKLFV